MTLARRLSVAVRSRQTRRLCSRHFLLSVALYSRHCLPILSLCSRRLSTLDTMCSRRLSPGSRPLIGDRPMRRREAGDPGRVMETGNLREKPPAVRRRPSVVCSALSPDVRHRGASTDLRAALHWRAANSPSECLRRLRKKVIFRGFH